MSATITVTIDGKECTATPGQTVVAAAAANGIYIPALCDFKGLPPAATCRICTVYINGKPATACTTPVAAGMVIENDTERLNDFRKAIVEMLFAEGNHFCPSCEKSGSCELQALAYRFGMMVPRYPFLFPQKPVDASHPLLLLEKNRCVLCKRCVRAIRTEDGKSVFAFVHRGHKTEIAFDAEAAASMSEATAQAAMDICPVGAIIRKERGFRVPIGRRPYDLKPIGSKIEEGV